MTSTHAEEIVVRFTDVVKSYGPVRAVNGINLTIRRGECVALLGPNGAGKSTSIGLMLGLLLPDSGRIEIFGRPPEQAMRSGQVGALLQEGSLIPRVTVRELVGFIRGTYPSAPPLEETLRIANLDDLAGRRVDKLSGGQSQRVRFAIAMAGGSDLVVLDEPTAALDVESRRQLWTAMRAYAARGKTILFSTHYLEEADVNADRIVVIGDGSVLAEGTSDDIKSLVADRTVSIVLGADDPDELRALPGVTSVTVQEGRAHIATIDSDATVLALAARGAVRGLLVSGAGIEEAFVALTERNRPGPVREGSHR